MPPPKRKRNTTLLLNVMIKSQSSIKLKTQRRAYTDGIEKYYFQSRCNLQTLLTLNNVIDVKRLMSILNRCRYSSIMF